MSKWSVQFYEGKHEKPFFIRFFTFIDDWLWSSVLAGPKLSRWWFQIFFIFIPIWGRFPFWLIFFRGVETTNQLYICCIICLFEPGVESKGIFVRFLRNIYFILKLWHLGTTGSTIRTLLHGKSNPNDWQVLSLGDAGFFLFFRLVSGDYGKPWTRIHDTHKG